MWTCCLLQVQRTSDNVAAAGRSAWRATKWTTKRAVEAPLHLMHLLGSNSDENEGDDEFGGRSQESGLRETLREARSAMFATYLVIINRREVGNETANVCFVSLGDESSALVGN